MSKNKLAKTITSIIKKAQGETFRFSLSKEQKRQIQEAGERTLQLGMEGAKQEQQQTERGTSDETNKQPDSSGGSSLLRWILGIGGLGAAGGGLLAAYKYRHKLLPLLSRYTKSFGTNAAKLLGKVKEKIPVDLINRYFKRSPAISQSSTTQNVSGVNFDAYEDLSLNIPDRYTINRDEVIKSYEAAIDLSGNRINVNVQRLFGSPDILTHPQVGGFAGLLATLKTAEEVSPKEPKAQAAALELVHKTYFPMATFEAQMHKNIVKQQLIDVLTGKTKDFSFIGIVDSQLGRIWWNAEGMQISNLTQNERQYIKALLLDRVSNLRASIKSIQYFTDVLASQASRLANKDEISNLQAIKQKLDAYRGSLAGISNKLFGIKPETVDVEKDLHDAIMGLHKINRELLTSPDVAKVLEIGRSTGLIDAKVGENLIGGLYRGELLFQASATGKFADLNGIKFLVNDIDLTRELARSVRGLMLERLAPQSRMYHDTRMIGFIKALARRR
jgi:hypothetical protein